MQCASAAMAAINRRRLAQVLELLSSDQPGERQAAAEAANRLVRASGLRWTDVLDPPPQRPPEPRRRASRRSPPWRSLLATCRAHPELLTRWEREFVGSLSGFRTISKKQYAILARLAGRVRQ
jgi:hypothetical protein